MFDFIKNISQSEFVVIIVIVLLLVFGSRLVKTLARTSGETVRDVKKVKKTFSDALSGEEPDVKS